MILAIVDSDHRLKLYEVNQKEIQELAALQVASTDPADLARIAVTLADMAGHTSRNGKAPRKPRAVPDAPRGSVKLKLLTVLASNGGWWSTTKAAQAAGVPPGGTSASFNQWTKADQLEKRDSPGKKRPNGQPVYEYRITPAGKEALRQLTELLGA